MAYHVWGDDWFKENQQDLYDAETKIRKIFEERTGSTVSTKEKYGTIVYEHTFTRDEETGDLSHWDQIEDWHALYNVIQDVVKDYPHLEEELLEDIAAHEEIVGKEVHNKYWKKL
jgi:hypothetical protein